MIFRRVVSFPSKPVLSNSISGVVCVYLMALAWLVEVEGSFFLVLVVDPFHCGRSDLSISSFTLYFPVLLFGREEKQEF